MHLGPQTQAKLTFSCLPPGGGPVPPASPSLSTAIPLPSSVMLPKPGPWWVPSVSAPRSIRRDTETCYLEQRLRGGGRRAPISPLASTSMGCGPPRPPAPARLWPQHSRCSDASVRGTCQCTPTWPRYLFQFGSSQWRSA